MSRILGLSCTLQSGSILAVRLTRCNYCSDKGGKQNDDTVNPSKTTAGTTDDNSVVPMPMSYNSYEDLSSVQTTPPILIMHGVYSVNKFFENESDWNYNRPRSHSGLFGSKQNWRSISKAIHSKTNPTRKVRPTLSVFHELNWIKSNNYGRFSHWMPEITVRAHIRHGIDILIWLKTFIYFIRSIKYQKLRWLAIAWAVEQWWCLPWNM